MKKVLISGGSGFIGRYMCKECENQGIDYLATYNSAPADREHACKVNLLDYEELKKALAAEKPDTVIHLAAIASTVHNDIAELYRVNVGGTENLLKAMAETVPGARLMLTSTAGVYGNQNIPYLHEDLPYNPVNHYSCSKMITEIWSRQYADQLNITIVRPFNIIGYGQNENFFVPKLVKNFASHAEEIRLGNLDAVRDYVSVDFCARVFIKLASMTENVPPVVNICTGIGHSCRQVIELLEELTGEEPNIVSTASYSRSNEVWRLVGDNTRLNSVLNNEFSSSSLRDVLENMLAHYSA